MTTRLLVLLVASFVPRASPSSVPWQSSLPKDSAVEQGINYREVPPFVFAPNGRLHSVEAVAEAASSKDDASSNLVVATLCDNGSAVVVASTSTKSPYLDDQTRTTVEDDKNNNTTSETVFHVIIDG